MCVCVCTERKNNNIQLIYHTESNQLPYIQPQGKGTPAHTDLIPTDLFLEFLPFKLLVLLALLHFKLTGSSLSPLVHPCSPNFYKLHQCHHNYPGGKLKVVLDSFCWHTPCLYSIASSFLSSLALLHLSNPGPHYFSPGPFQ